MSAKKRPQGGDAPDSPHTLMLRDLARSGLDAADAKRLKYEPLTADQTRELTDRYNVPSYRIPYFDVAGDDTEFFRLRFLTPVYVNDDEGKKKELRYWQPEDTVPHAYFPPSNFKWTKVMRNAAVETAFTEGEKKAAKACKEGVICIGLGGVWNYQSKEAHIGFLPELSDFDWSGRRTVTYYDGIVDEELDKQVLAARARLKDRLEARGALHEDGELPPGVKLDDYLLGHTKDELKGLSRAGSWSPPQVVAYGAAFNPAKIERREWVIPGRYARGEGTAVVGPPGTNKSMLFLNDAVQIATGIATVPGESVAKGGVLLLVGEDSRRDVEARIAAICQRHGIPPAALADRLRVIYQTEIDPLRYTLARMEDDMAALNRQMFNWLKGLPDLAAIFIDPMAAWSHVLENSNDALRVLLLGLRNLAVAKRAAVAFDHHINKVSMAEDPETHVHNLAAVRGGTHIAADMRWGFTMARLSAATADAYGIEKEQRRLYRRLDRLKASYGPEGEGDEPLAIFKVETVRIANGEDVGVLTAVDAAELRISGEKRQEARRRAFSDGLGASLAAMLDAEGPCSISAAAQWIAGHATNLYVRGKGEPLAERSIRTKLPTDIGEGIFEPARNGERGRKIVMRPSGKGRSGDGLEITFAEPLAPKAAKGAKRG